MHAQRELILFAFRNFGTALRALERRADSHDELTTRETFEARTATESKKLLVERPVESDYRQLHPPKDAGDLAEYLDVVGIQRLEGRVLWL